jgi:hypothetical protein
MFLKARVKFANPFDSRNRFGTLVVIGIIAVVTLVVWMGVTGGTKGARNAKAEACTYMKELYPDEVKCSASCTQVDTDGDGYVRCTAVAGQHKEHIECAVDGSVNDGCAAARPNLGVFGE